MNRCKGWCNSGLRCKKNTINEYCNIHDENIICQGVSKNLDDVFLKYNENLELFEKIREYLNQLIKIAEKNQELDHVKKHETEKSGFSLIITKTRGKLLKTVFANMLKENPESTVEIENKKIPVKDIRLVSATGSNDEITFPLLTQTTKNILFLKEEVNKETAKVYQEILSVIERDWFQCLENLTKYVGKIDVITTKAFIAREYNYCRPEIVENSPKSFLNAENLRHPLIEHINTNEIYVPNDICIGAPATQGDLGIDPPSAGHLQDPPKAAQNTIPPAADGILLFGTNAVGKTSLIRAVGITLIMAQCGCFVPCSRFQYKPYTAIYSRILGNDNLFKGLSTFMVEMSELRTILKMADENSLILGDELASGTENESALSIFASGLIDLHKKRASFIFATHMHEIVHFEEIGELEKLALKHLEVYYDREQDCLVYNRKLKEGAGNRMYGLEVCRSLHMPEDFLETAMKIRGRYFPETGGELSMKPSHFNSKKIRGLCEICKVELSEETHHMSPQRDADKNGFIGTFHKNHPANLLAVCEKCHDKIHKTPEKEKQVRKKTTKGYMLATV
jgi:DNA mismatch repair protein MutS